MTKPNKDGQIVRGGGRQDLGKLLRDSQGEIQKALPKHVTPERMTRIATTALRTNPKLNECTQVSFLGSVLSAAQLGLEVNTPLGQAYLIPRKGRGGEMECTLQIGYQGMMDLVRRSGEVKDIYAYTVREGDEFLVTLGLSRNIKHVQSDAPDRDKKAITHAYAVAILRDGSPVFEVITRADIDKARQRSGGGNYGPWETDYEAMVRKTAVRRLFKWLPKAAEVAGAAALDEAQEHGSQAAAWDHRVVESVEEQGFDVPGVEIVEAENG